MILDAKDNFHFGKFQGRNVLSTWTGANTAKAQKVVSSFIKEQIQHATGTATEDRGKLYPCLDMGVVCREFQQVRATSPNFSIIISDKYIILEGLTRHDKLLVREILETILKCNIENTNRSYQPYGTIPYTDFTPVSKALADLIPEPDYFHYCVNNISDNCFKPQLLSALNQAPSSFLTGFSFTYINDDIIEYSPTFRTYQCTISSELLERNEERYDEFVFYHSPIEDDWDGLGEESEFDGSYARDVEDWSDDDINDVLDGDPDAYWNID